MLYAIRTRLVAVAFLLLAFTPTNSLAQEPNSENVSVDRAQKPVSDFISLRSDASAVETAPGDVSDLASAKPADAVDFNNLGVRYAKQKHYDEALSMLARAVKLDPKVRSFYVNMCNIYDKMDRPQDALDALRQAAKLAPFNGVEQAKECELLLFAEQNQESVICYRSFEEKTPLDYVSKINLGIGLMRLERWKEADEALEPVEAEMRFNAHYYNAIGMVRYHTKQYKGAVEAFKRATELAPEEMDARFNLALAQLAIRDKPGALSQYKFLSESDPKLAQELYRIIYRDKLLFVDNK